MNALYVLRDMLCNELEGIVSSNQGNIPLDIVDKVTHSLKSVETIIAMKEGTGKYNYNDYKSNYNNSYGRNTGSYGYNKMNYNRNYMGRSYGDSKEEMMSELHEMMNNAKSEQERQAFQQFINQMQNM